MSSAKGPEEEGYFEKVSRKIKFRVFFILNELMDSYKVSVITYNFLLIIETLQILFFAYQNNLPYMWDNQVVRYSLEVLNYIQFERILASTDNSIKMSIFYIMLASIFGVLIFFAIIIFNFDNKDRHNKTLFKYSVKLCCFFMILHNSVFTIPVYQSLFNMVICQTGKKYSLSVDSCYKGVNLANSLLAVAGLVIFFIELLFINLFIHEMNPNSKLPSASFNLNQNALRTIYKLFFCLFTVLDHSGDFRQFVVIGGVVVLFLNLFFFRLNYPPLYNKLVNKLSIFLDAFLLYMYLILLIQIYADTNSGKEPIGFAFIIVGIVLELVFISCLWKMKMNKTIKRTVKDLKNQGDVIDFCVMMIRLIKNRDHPGDYMKLQGIFKVNSVYFDKAVIANLSALTDSSKVEEGKNDEDLIETKWFEFLVLVLNETIKKNGKSTQLKLMVAYLYYFKLKNKWKAIYSLTEMAASKPSMMEQFSGERIVKAIEKELQDIDLKNIDTMGIDILTIFEFKNNFASFQINIKEAVNLQVSFWTELMNENPDIQKLISLGSILTKKFEELEQLFGILSSYEINNSAYLELYSSFLLQIIHDEFESKRILEKLDMIVKNRGGNHELHEERGDGIGDNSAILIITVSGNKDNLGEILNVGNEIKYFLKYKPNDVIGNNVNTLMPEFYSKKHDDYMTRYLETGEAHIIGKKRNIYAQDKQGYLKGCSLFLKVLPDLSEGIHFIGMIREFDSVSLGKLIMEAITGCVSHYMIYDAVTGKIMGLSQSLFRAFGLKASLFKVQSSNTPVIQHICPDFMDSDVVRDMRNSEKGAMINFDTSNLKEVQFYAGMDDSESYSQQRPEHDNDRESYESSDWQREKLKRFRKARCKAWITAIERTDNHELHCVRFIELEQNDEFNQYKEGSHAEIAEVQQKEILIEEDKKDENGGSMLEDGKENQQDEEIRQIKDSRTLMSEKKNPKSIKTLQRVFVVLALLALGSEIFLKVRRKQEIDDLSDRVGKYLSLFRRNIILTDIGYYLRKYELLINDKFTGKLTDVAATKSTEKQRILDLVKNLENEQITCAVAHNDIEASKFSFNYNYTFQQPMSTGTISSVLNSYSDAVYTLSSAVTITVNSEELQLKRSENTPTKLTSGYVSFRRYMSNVYDNMRIGGSEYTTRYRDLTENKLKNNFLFALIYYLCQVIIVIIASSVLIRYVFDVMNKNKEVMTLFAMIEQDQIRKLMNECNQFIDKNLKDLNDGDSEEEEQHANKPQEEKLESEDESEESQAEDEDEKIKEDENMNATKSQQAASTTNDEKIKKQKEQEEFEALLNVEVANLIPPPEERQKVENLKNTSIKSRFELKNKLFPYKGNPERDFADPPPPPPAPVENKPEKSDKNKQLMQELKEEGTKELKLANTSKVVVPTKDTNLPGENSTKRASVKDKPAVEVEKLYKSEMPNNQTYKLPPGFLESAPPAKKEAEGKQKTMKKKSTKKKGSGKKKTLKEEPGATGSKVKEDSMLKENKSNRESVGGNNSKEAKAGDNSKSGSNKSRKEMSKIEQEEKDEEMQNRINKLKNSKDSNKKVVVMKFFFISLFIIALYTGLFVWAFVLVKNQRKIVGIVYNIGTLANHIKLSVLVFAENIALCDYYSLAQPSTTAFYKTTGEALYEKMHSQSYLYGNYLSQDIREFPPGYSSFEDTFRSILLVGACANYLSPKRNIQCADDSVLKSGLELINIKILEYSKQKLASLFTKDASGAVVSTLDPANILALYQSDYLESERYAELAGYTYEYILSQFSSEFGNESKKLDIYGTLVLVAWILLILMSLVFIWFRYIKDLSNNIWRIQGMLSMIPTEIVCSNAKMKSQFIEGGLAKGVK